MYNYNFLCTYKFHEYELQEDMYRVQLLQAFNLEKWDDGKVDVAIKELYNSVKEYADIQTLIHKAKQSNQLQFIIHLTGNDNYVTFTLLFKFELFEQTHKCLCELNKRENISNENMQELINLMSL